MQIKEGGGRERGGSPDIFYSPPSSGFAFSSQEAWGGKWKGITYGWPWHREKEGTGAAKVEVGEQQMAKYVGSDRYLVVVGTFGGGGDPPPPANQHMGGQFLLVKISFSPSSRLHPRVFLSPLEVRGPSAATASLLSS